MTGQSTESEQAFEMLTRCCSNSFMQVGAATADKGRRKKIKYKKKAEELYRAAADRGHAVAQSSLAFLLYSEKKYEEAFRYFALAAEQGLTLAEACLGMCYEHGKGTEVDLGKARYWFKRAAAKGDENAIKSLALLDARV